MEKDDKIRDQQEKTKKYGVLMVVGFVLVCGIYSMKKSGHNFQAETAIIREDIKKVENRFLKKSGAGADPGGNVAAAAVADPKPVAGAPDYQAVQALEAKRLALDTEIRAIKKTGIIMETDPVSLKKTGELKDVTRNLLKAKYGDHPAYRVKVDLEFQPSIPDFAEKGPDGTIVIEMAPIDLQPVSVYNFMEIARTWIKGAFHRNAHHVLQVMAISDVSKSLPFQEYSKEFPHKKGTTGYAGRPSGPGWYVSIMDNSINHGPGSQQQKNPYEADANFGTVVEGFNDVVPRIHTAPQMGWLDQKNHIKIIRKTILIPDGNGGFQPWEDWTKDAAAKAALQ